MDTLKVKVKYFIPIEETIEMTPEDFCYFHANTNYKNFIPENARYLNFDLASEEDEQKLDDFFDKKNTV
jgi:hypothetical protein